MSLIVLLAAANLHDEIGGDESYSNYGAMSAKWDVGLAQVHSIPVHYWSLCCYDYPLMTLLYLVLNLFCGVCALASWAKIWIPCFLRMPCLNMDTCAIYFGSIELG
jgi:hypothetical protein|tara:strand:- start:311 stop:628 length:318 start_codon:yes stop_codon:yes gene_type:complete